VFDCRNHKLIEWIDGIAQEEGTPVKDEHWSNHAMSLEDVAMFLGQIRQAKKR
jgi:hypothetical protein